MKQAAVVAIALCGWLAGARADPAKPGVEGAWAGTLEAGGAKLRLVLHVARGADGAWSATMDSLDQQAVGIPFDKVSFQAPTLHVEQSKLHAVFEGALAGDTLTGTWTQGQAFPLTLTRQEVRRPQRPLPPFPYREQEVTIAVQPQLALAGTLVIPAGKGPFPAAVFITGSGPQDRDETLFDHKPFLVLADALARRGIASLRVDDRGVGKSQGDRSGTTLDYAADAQKLVAWLAARPEIDRRAVGVIGHSEGGVIGPIAATRTADIRFVVMLAGSGLPGDQVILAQSEALLRASQATPAQVAAAHATNEKLYTQLRAARGDAAWQAVVTKFLADMPAARDQERVLRSAWLRVFLTLDPAPYLAKLRVPVLAISGDRDRQVTPENLTAIEAALRRGKNPDATVKQIAGVNHLFQHAATGLPQEYGTIEETIAPEVLQLVTDWVVQRAAKLRGVPAAR